MRRLLALATTFALVLVVASTAVGVEGEYGTYKDNFDHPVYDGSNGSIDWSNSPWQEFGDDGSPTDGLVHVSPEGECAEDPKCLHIQGDLELLEPRGVKRFADLSGFETAELCFDLITYVDLELLDLTDGRLEVWLTRDHGEHWDKKTYYDLAKIHGEHLHPTISIGEWIGEGFGVKLKLTGALGGEVFIDRVELKGLLAQSTTTSSSTTTTTKPTTTTTKATTTTTKRDDTTTTSSTTTTSTTTTTVRDTTTTTQRDTTSTTTVPETTTTTEEALVAPPEGPPPDSGIRQAATGIQASFGTNAYGDVTAGGPDVLGVEFDADYTIAAEIIESSWVWMLGLVLLIATAIVSGMDRRRVGTSELPV